LVFRSLHTGFHASDQLSSLLLIDHTDDVSDEPTGTIRFDLLDSAVRDMDCDAVFLAGVEEFL